MDPGAATQSSPESPIQQASSASERLREIVWIFTWLGFTAFGGPAAHISMMRRELVERRRWVTEERFADLLGASNLIPGPTSTELAISLGYVRAGWLGLLLAGLCFITPAMVIVLALAWTYVRFGALPQVGWLFYGVQPVVIAVIAQALWGLRRVALKRVDLGALVVAVVALYLIGVPALALLIAGACFSGGAALLRGRRLSSLGLAPLLGFGGARLGSSAAVASATVTFSYGALFWTFLKFGAVTYGSGYVLLAFLRADLVQGLGWLTDRQLLDAVSIGQFTPGPVFTTATFIGYVVGGWQGALLATVAIFLPSFAFVPMIQPLATRLRASSWTAPLLDGVNVASLGLMAGVLVQLGGRTLVDPLTWLVATLAFIALARFRWNAALLIAVGALIGIARFLLIGAP